jgi:hypothetical protein
MGAGSAAVSATNGHDQGTHSISAEQAVLGSLLIGAPWSAVTNRLKPGDFARPDHALIFSAMSSLAASGQSIDPVTVAEHLRRFDHVDAAGGRGYLITLANETPTADNACAYADIVLERSLRRRLHGIFADSGRLTPDAASQAAHAVAQLQSLATGQGTPAAPLHLLWYAALDDVVHQDQLVKGLISVGTLFVIYGESNSGKTFWILDLALAVAAGRRWRGRCTKRGLVVYVAGEGAASVRSRVAAFRREHADIGAGIPFCIVPQPVDFLSAASTETLIRTIRAAEVECGEKAVLVVIDTFARAIPGGNENDAKDVGIAVAAADRLRSETGAAVGFIHHAGKDPTKGARGSSALRAATDTEILIEGQNGTRTATVTKQRDLPIGDKFAFELRQLVLGRDADGDAITSCVVEEAETPRLPTKVKGENKKKLFAALKEWQRTNPGKEIISSFELAALAKKQGFVGSRKREVMQGLEKDRVLSPSVGGHRINLAGFIT